MNNKYEIAKQCFLENPNRSLASVCEEFKISKSRFSYYLRDLGIESDRRKKSVNSRIFKEINTEEKAYWLGFLFADGYVMQNRNVVGLALCQDDLEHLCKFKNFISYKGNIRMREKYNSCSIEFRDTEMKNDLIRLGCVPKKSLTLKFPQDIDEKFYKDFIRGYFDGDGCTCFTDKTSMVSLIGTYDFLIKVCEIVNIDKERIYLLDKDSQNYRIVLSSLNDMLKFLDFIYDNANIYLERKYEKYILIRNANQ